MKPRFAQLWRTSVKRNSTATAVLAASALYAVPSIAEPISASFARAGPDRVAIQALLDAYAKAVSEKNQALFETILLGTDIPFSDVRSATRPGHAAGGTRN